jgi:indole-3-glycerol phosphate synthase
MTVLETIVANKREEVAARKRIMSPEELRSRLRDTVPARAFRAALVDPLRPSPRVIAELKRRSPSRGMLRDYLDAPALARVYEQNGASAVSVLVDGRFFGGSLDDLRSVSAAVSVPTLCKEFIIDTYQIYEARLAGADAVLLIAAILMAEDLRQYRQQAASLGMDALIEVHNRAELETALESGAEIIGINNRDLHTFRVSLDTTRELRPLIPAGVVTVSESGISSAADRPLMASLQIDALLVGESLLASSDIARATRELCGLQAPSLEGSII